MANIELNIVALGDFSSVQNQIKALQAQVALLNKATGGLGLNPVLSKNLQSITNDFSNALVASGQFSKQTISLQTETEKFGAALQKGSLGLGNYYQIITKQNGAATNSIKALAVEQTKLQNSIITSDPTKQGFYSVYTPKNIDLIANSTKIAANEANLYAIAVNKGSQALINFGKNTQWAGRQLTVGMSMPLLLFGQQAVSQFDKVNTALTQLQKVYGEGLIPPSDQTIQNISNQVLDLGKSIASTMGIAQSDTIATAASFAAMGKQGQQLLDITAQTERLAKLGNLDQTTATNAMIALQNVYKLSTTGTADAVNFLGAMQKQTSLSMTDLVQAESRVGPIIDQLGGSYKDTAIMLLAMKEAGVPAAQAANALKTAFASIIAPSSAANKEFAKYGISLDKIKHDNGPVAMIQDLQNSLKGLSPLVREQLIEKLFGKFQFTRMSALIANFGQVGSQTVNALKVAGATSSELTNLANQEMKKATSSPSAQWQIALQTLKADLYPIGQTIIKVGTEILKFGNAVSKVFSGLPAPVKMVLGIMAGFVALSGPIIMLTGLLANFAGYLLRGAFNLKQLVTGGKTLGQLLTPELVASQNAAELFSKGIIGDVDAINLLSTSIKDLTNNLTAMISTMNAGAGIQDLATTIAGVAQAETRVYEQAKIPGFAAGKIVGPGSGTSDSIIARVSNGETIIPADKSIKYADIINAIITGKFPSFATGKQAISDMFRGRDLSHMSAKIVMPDGTVYEPGPSGSVQYSQLSPQHQAMAQQKFGYSAEEIANDPKIKNAFVSGYDRQVNQAQAGGNLSIDAMKSYLSGTPTELQAGKGVVKHDPLVAYSTIMDDIGVAAKDRVATAAKIDSALIAKLEEAKASGKTHIADVVSREEQISGDILGSAVEDVAKQNGYNTSNLYGMTETRTNYTSSSGKASRRRAFGAQTTTAGGAALASKARRGTEFSGTAASFQSEVEQGYDSAIANILAQEKASGTKIGETLVTSSREAIKAASPSKEGEQLAIDFGDGIDLGAQKVVPKVEEIGTNVGKTLTESTATAITENASMIETAAGETATRAGSTMMQKIKATMTSGMGAGMAAMMAAPLVGKVNGTAGSVLSNAGMVGSAVAMIPGLNAFTPEIMAGTAAITLAYKGIDKIIQDIHTHNAQVAADTSGNTDAVQLIGGTVANTTHVMTQFNDILDKVATTSGPDLAKGLSVSNDQIKTFTDHVNNLPKDNQLSLVMQQLKGISDDGSAAKIAQQFAASEMAINGISQTQANSLIQLMLASTGHNAAGATTNTPANQLQAIKTTLASLKPGTKEFETFVGTLSDVAVNTTSWDTYKSIIDAIGSSAKTSDEYLTGLINHLNSVGDTKAAGMIQNFKAAGFTGPEIQDMQTASALGILLNTTGSGPGLPFAANNKKDDAAIEAAIQAAKNKLKLDQAAAANASSAAANGGISTASQAATDASLKAQIRTLTDKKKIIDAELKTQKDITAEMQRQMQYQAAQTTAAEDAKTALESGNYIKAAQYKQQAAYNTMSFNAQTKANSLQNQSDALANQIADLTDQQSKLAAAIQANTSAVVSSTAAKVAADTSVPAAPPTVAFGQLATPNNIPSLGAAYNAAKAAKVGNTSWWDGGKANFDPAQWNNIAGKWSLGLTENSRQGITKLIDSQYTAPTDPKGRNYVTFDHNDMQYLFAQLKGGKVELMGSGKIGTVWDSKTGKYVDPSKLSVNLPTPTASASASIGGSVAAGGIQQNFQFNLGGSVDSTVVAQLKGAAGDLGKAAATGATSGKMKVVAQAPAGKAKK